MKRIVNTLSRSILSFTSVLGISIQQMRDGKSAWSAESLGAVRVVDLFASYLDELLQASPTAFQTAGFEQGLFKTKYLFNGCRASVWMMKNIMEMMVAQQCEYFMPLNYILKNG